jgi:hypothetical protein
MNVSSGRPCEADRRHAAELRETLAVESVERLCVTEGS